MTNGTRLKKQLGLENYPVVRICRILISTYRIYVIFFDSKMTTRPLTNNEIGRAQYFLPGMEKPFKEKPRLLPLLNIEDFNGDLNRAMFFVLDVAGRYADNRLRTKQFESVGFMTQGNLKEYVTMADLADAAATSDSTKNTRSQRNRAVGAENRTAKLVDVNIDTVEDHVTFIFKTTATLPIYPDDAIFKKTNKNNFQLQNNPDKEYELYIRILDFLKWLKETKPDAESITLQDVKDVLSVNNVQVFSTSPSFHWIGHNYNLSQFDGSIYPTDIPPRVWSQRLGTDEYFVDKHLAGLIRQMGFFKNPMASMLNKKLKDRELL